MFAKAKTIDEQASLLAWQEALCPAALRALAESIVRAYLPSAACDAPAAPHECRFRGILCPHGCGLAMSICAAAAHDEQCKAKLVACELCGELVPRSKRKIHADSVCRRRSVPCPFAELGCCEPLVAEGVQAHCEKASTAHLLICARSLTEHQGTLTAIADQVQKLHEDHALSEMRSLAQDVQRGAEAVTRLEALVSRQGQALEEGQRRGEAVVTAAKDFKALAPRIDKLEATVSKLQTEMTAQRATFARLEKLLTDSK
jgi:hypothetical protein